MFLDKVEQIRSPILTVATAELAESYRADMERGLNPRVDYIELNKQLGVDILNYNTYKYTPFGSLYRHLETRLRSDLYLTLLSLIQRRHYQVLFAMSERAGIPLAALNQALPARKKLVAMFQSWSHRQEFVIRQLKLCEAMDAILVHAQSMKQVFIELGAKPENIHVVPYGIDHLFFTPQVDTIPQKGHILSVGEVRSRDYDLLFRSVDGLPVEAKVLAGGMWYAREKDHSVKTTVPGNVQVCRGVGHAALRDLYARSQFVVLPVRNLVYSAGATASLEAMAMGRAVIATRSAGIGDYIIDGETGLLVEPDNPEELRAAILDLLHHPRKAQQMGENGRQFVEQKHNIDIYTARMGEILRAVSKT